MARQGGRSSEQGEPAGVQSLEDYPPPRPGMKGRWVRMDITVDSGSATHCIPAHMLPDGCPIQEAPGPKEYTSASQHKLRVLGQATLQLSFLGGQSGAITFRVLDTLQKPLLSVGTAIKNGAKVFFDPKLSYLESDQALLRIFPSRGVYILPTWCWHPDPDPHVEHVASPPATSTGTDPQGFLGVGHA